MPGSIIKVSPRTACSWLAVPQQTATAQTIIQKYIPIWQWREISLLIRNHVLTTGSAGSKVTIAAVSTNPSDEDPQIQFGMATPLATTDIATATAAGVLFKMDISPQSSTPVNAGAYLAIVMYATGATSGATDITATLSMDLVCKC